MHLRGRQLDTALDIFLTFSSDNNCEDDIFDIMVETESGIIIGKPVSVSQTVSDVLQAIEPDLSWYLRMGPVALYTLHPAPRMLRPSERMASFRPNPTCSMQSKLYIKPLKRVSLAHHNSIN